MKRNLFFMLAVLTAAIMPMQKAEAQNTTPYYYVIGNESDYEFVLARWGYPYGYSVSEGDTLLVSGFKEGVAKSNLSNIPKEMTVVWVHPKSMSLIGYDPMKRDTLLCYVAGIAGGAFKECQSLTNISLPSHIIKIGAEAFENCPNLKSATIVRTPYISSRAFMGCPKLGTFTLRNTCTRIGESAFENCTALASLSLPSTIENIGERAFAGCTNLAEFISPSSLVDIDREAFLGCTRLYRLILGERLERLGGSAFSGCTGLQTVSVACGSKKPATFEGNAFAGCTAIEKVYPQDLERWLNISFSGKTSNPLYYGHNLYIGNSVVKTLDIPSGVTKINSYAFAGATCLKHVVMNHSKEHVMEVGYDAFVDCTSLEKVTVPRMDYWCDIVFDSPDANPLSYAHHLWEPPSVDHADGQEITRLEIPGNATRINKYAFYNATALERIEIGGKVNEIENYAFYGCVPKRIYSHIISPPELPANAFNPQAYSTTELVVPNHVFVTGSVADSETLYKQTRYWYKFYNIRPIGHYDFEIDPGLNTTATGQLTITSDGSGAVAYDGSMVRNATKTFAFDYSTWNGIDLEISIMPDQYCSLSGLTVNGESRLADVTDGKLVLTGVNYDVALQASFAGGISFADKTVETLCLKNWDGNRDGELSFAEAAAVKDIGTVFNRSSITSFDELQYFTGLTSIDDLAFAYCTSLKSIKLPPTITSIGSAAFTSCERLKVIEIPASVTGFGYSPFSYCYSLEKITVAEGNRYYSSPDGCNAVVGYGTLHFGCKNTVIPPTVGEIGPAAFMGMSGLTSITIPPSVYLIDQDAFQGTGLKEIDIPETVGAIWGAYTFGECQSLKKVTVHWQEPIELDYGNPFYVNIDEERVIATLYVPYGTKALYASADGWCEFGTIVEMEAKTAGDLNGDNSVDVGDIMAIINIMAAPSGSPEGGVNGDINGDGNVDVGDIMAIINIMAGH